VAGLRRASWRGALGLGGGAYTLDAACASSLYAVKLAADELRAGRADAMLTGGLSRPDPPLQTDGLRPASRPVDDGQGSSLRRARRRLGGRRSCGDVRAEAARDDAPAGDTIYGVIAGAGLSNDVDGGLLAPSSEGQLRAMRAAYADAGWEPSDVDLIECHATGTPVGDAVEFASLQALWEDGDRSWSAGQCVISSVKANNRPRPDGRRGRPGYSRSVLALKHNGIPRPPTSAHRGRAWATTPARSGF